MNFPRIYRRFAVIAVGILLVGLLPASAMADGVRSFSVVISGDETTAGVPVTVTVDALMDGVLDPTYTRTITFTSSDPLATVADGGLPSDYTFTGDDAGEHVFAAAITFKTAGDQTVSVADTLDPASLSSSDALTVDPAAADHLVVSAPATATVGVASSVTVTATDPYGNTDTNYTGTVTLSSKTDGGATFEADHQFTSGVSQDNGSYTFDSGVTFANAGGSQTVTATDTVSAITGDSDPVDVSQGTPTLAFTSKAPGAANLGDPGSTTVGGSNYTPTFNLTAGDTGTITVSTHSGSTGCSVNSNVVSFTAVGTCVIDATAAADSNWTTSNTVSQTITIGQYGLATILVVSGPASAVGDAAQSYTVTAKDQNGQTVLNYPGTVAITSSDPAAKLPANATLTNGVGTFSVTFTTAGTQSVTATDTVQSGITGSLSGIDVTRTTSTYYPVTPVRLLDSRNGNGLAGGTPAKLKAGVPVTIPIAGRGGISLSAVAVTVNATIVKPSAASTLFLGPTPIAHPSTFSIAFNANDVTAYGLTVALNQTTGPSKGSISATYMAGSGTTDLVLDITGYFAPDSGGDTYIPMAPARLLDTRHGNGLSGKFTALVPRTFQVTGRDGVPSTAKAVTGNLTVTNSNNSWAVYLGPVKTASPSTSTINFSKGQTRANSLTVPLAAGGTLSATFLSTKGKTTDLVFDVTGYYVSGTSGAEYVPLTSVALLDTRTGIGLTGKVNSNQPRTFTVSNRGGVPSIATGVTGVLAVMNQTSSWAAFVGPTPTAAPSTSALNFVKGDHCSNGLTVSLSGTGTLSVTYMGSNGNTTDMVVFITGYFVDSAP